MKRIFRYLTLVAILEMAGTIAAFADDLTASANQTIASFKQRCPAMVSLFNNSAGYAVFPSVGRGGLVVGGEHGNGVVYQNYQNSNPCQPIGRASVGAASIGAQIGGETFTEVIFFQTPEALQQFKEGKSMPVAKANIVVVNAGKQLTVQPQQCGTSAYVMNKNGLMLQATVGAERMKYEGRV